MKKTILIFVLLLSSFVLVSCSRVKYSNKDKKDIVFKKYGEIEYIIEEIIVYKNLKDDLPFNEEIEYIINNSGNRGTVQPTFKENYYLHLDIVKQEDECKILMYNDYAKRFTNKNKMFVLVDYFLPVKMEEVYSFIDEYNMDISRLLATYIKKDDSLDYEMYSFDIISNYFYKIHDNGTNLLQFHDPYNGYAIVYNGNDFIVGNMYKEIVYYPNTITYEDVMDYLESLEN